MKNLKALFFFCLFAISFVSCDDNDSLLEDSTGGETTLYDAEILVTEDGIDNKISATIDVVDNFNLKVKVTFKGEKMRRLYITENIEGQGVSLYTPDVDFDDKADGSIDLETKYKEEVEFIIPITAPTITDGTVVYKFWTTSNRGDIRDVTKNLSLGTATLTLNYGTKTNAQAPVKEFSAKLLAAPLADKTSNTFMSLLDGNVYNMNQGVEFVAFWDFGFLYGASTQAGLYSVSNYPKSGFDIASVNNEGDALNATKFRLSDVTVDSFSAIERSNELDDINSESITSTKIQFLEVGNIIEFVDNYGKKGLIKVIEINPSAGTKGFIKIDVKMQA